MGFLASLLVLFIGRFIHEVGFVACCLPFAYFLGLGCQLHSCRGQHLISLGSITVRPHGGITGSKKVIGVGGPRRFNVDPPLDVDVGAQHPDPVIVLQLAEAHRARTRLRERMRGNTKELAEPD